MEPSSKDKQIQRSSRRREVNWPRLSLANYLVSWNSSELIWKYLPLNINKTSRRIQSSGRGSKRCVLPLEWIPWQVARDSGQICWILETSTTNLVNFIDIIFVKSFIQIACVGVQIVEVCMANQHKTGGLMELGEIRHKLIRSRGKSQHHQDITLDDLLRATKKLKVLGTGFTVIPLKSGRYLVQSVPGEMSLDQLNVLEQAEKSRGLVTEEVLSQNLKWEKQRSALILGKMYFE